MSTRVCLVVPCFNESGRWKTFYWKDLLALPEISWLFVDDGSTDETSQILNDYKSKNVEILTLGNNLGKAEAVRSGLIHIFENHPESDVIGFIDVDGAFSIEDVKRFTQPELLVKLDFYDSIWSSRVKLAGRIIARNPIRHFLARIISALLSLRFENMPYDSQSGLKLFKRSLLLNNILYRPFSTRWLFELEIIQRWQKESGRPLKIWEEPVMKWEDVEGSKIRGVELVRILSEVLKIMFLRKF